MIPSSKIYQRLELARCSMIADIRYRVDPNPLMRPALNELEWRGLMPLGTEDWTAEERADYTEKVNAILVSLNLPPVAEDIIELFDECYELLDEAGLPPQTTP